MVVIDYPELYKYKPVLYQINTFKYILKIKYPRKILQIKVIIHKNVQKLIYRHNFDARRREITTCIQFNQIIKVHLI